MRRPQPFFKKSRNTWYVQLDGRQINLGSNEQVAFNPVRHKICAFIAPRAGGIARLHCARIIAGIAGKRRDDVREEDVTGLKYFDKLAPLLARLRDVGCQRDKAGNRTLHFDQYTMLVLNSGDC